MLRKTLDAIFWKRAAARQDRIEFFFAAISKDDVNTVRAQLADGMNPNHLFHHNGERPLHVAAGFAGLEMIDCLIGAGAEPLVGIRVQASLLAPSGYAGMMRKTANEEHLRKIEHQCRQQMIAQGLVPPVFSEKVALSCRSSRCTTFPSRQTTSPKGP
jgi:hypothetical protein